jgi:HEPN domain-containing protein
VRKAEADLLGARSLSREKPPLHDLTCFHCQQSAEKYLKALLQELGIVPPRTHHLEDLLHLLLPSDPKLRILRRQLVSLSRFAVDFRYPGFNATKRHASIALRYAERIRLEIRTRLGLRP